MLHLFKRRTTLLFIITIIIISRFYNLSSDPPFDFDLGFIADEGWWSHNARNDALFGNPVLDEFNQQIIISYPFYIAQKIIFSILGIGYYQARLVSAIAGLMAILIFFLYIKREKDVDTAALSSLFLGLNYIFLAYCRLTLVDVTQILFLILSFYFIGFRKHYYVGCALSGIFFGLALITKTTVIFALGTFGFVFLYDLLDKKLEWKKIVGGFSLFSICLVFLLTCWFMFIVKPRGDEIDILYSRLAYDNFHGSLITAFKNIFTLFASITTHGINISQFITKMPVEQLLFWLYILHLLRSFLCNKDIKPLKRIDKLDLIFLSIILFGFLTLAPMTHKPLRRYVVFIPFISYFAARFTLKIKEMSFTKLFEILESKKIFSPIRMLLTFFLSLPILILLSPYFARFLKYVGSHIKLGCFDGFFVKSHISNFQVLSVFVIYLVCHFAVYFISIVKLRGEFVFKIQPHAVIVVFLVVTIIFYSLHFSSPSYTLRDTSRMLGAIFNENTLVIGGVADSLCFENKARTAHIWESPNGKILNERIIINNQADYLLSLKRAGDILIPEIELSSRLKLLHIDTFKLCPTKDGREYRVEVEFCMIGKQYK